MPYKFNTLKIHIPEEFDKRVKIPKSEHDGIRIRYKEGESLRQIARLFGVDKRLIQFILHPERLIQARKNRDWRKYHDQENITRLKRELDQRKASIFKVKGSKFNKDNSN